MALSVKLAGASVCRGFFRFKFLFLPHSFHRVLYSDHHALSVRDVSLVPQWCRFLLLVE